VNDENTVRLSCRCGTVQGTAIDITPSSGNRVVCCCNSCQAFARYLGREEDVLDEFGGTDIFQTSLSQVRVHQGGEQLRSMRLSPQGLLRWYTGCCNTPVGNTVKASIPFVGIVHSFLHADSKQLGPVRAYAYLSHARSTPDYPHGGQKFPLGITLRIMRKMLWWKLRGMGKKSVFFRDDGHPVSEPTVVS